MLNTEDYEVSRLLKAYAAIDAMEESPDHYGRNNALDYTHRGPRKAAMNVGALIKHTLGDVEARFVHTNALRLPLIPGDQLNPDWLEEQTPEVRALYAAGELLPGESSHDELKAMTLAAIGKDLDVFAPQYRQHAEARIAALLDLPAGENVREGVTRFEAGVVRDVAETKAAMLAAGKVADDLKAEYDKAHAAFQAAKKRWLDVGKDDTVRKVDSGVQDLDLVEDYAAKRARV
jgi:hypothetical protein